MQRHTLRLTMVARRNESNVHACLKHITLILQCQVTYESCVRVLNDCEFDQS